MALEPPPGYVQFVARNLAPLRRDAARVVGAEDDADVLYQDVLTDVAARWGWLQLRGALSRSSVADTYLNRAFARRSERWHADQADAEGEPDIDVWRGGALGPPPPPPAEGGPPVARVHAPRAPRRGGT